MANKTSTKAAKTFSDKQIYTNLRKLFESKLFTFSLFKQAHYSERLYRITGEKQFMQPLINFISSTTEKFSMLTEISGNKTKVKKYGEEYVENKTKKAKTTRLRNRAPVFEKFPEYKYYSSLIWYIYKYRELNFELGFTEKVQKILDSLKDYNFKKIILNEELIKVDPVQTTNFVYMLRRLKIQNFVSQFRKKCEKMTWDLSVYDEFMNLLYFYTHVIICESNYYQNFIDYKKFESYYDFFEKYLDEIIKSKNTDVLAEIGVCYLLAKQNNSPIVKKLRKELKKYLKKEDSFVQKTNEIVTKEELNKVEHRNVLTIMLFSDFKELNPGPDLNLKQKEQ